MLFLYTRDDASLGHAQLSTTMDTYVHVTDDSLLLAIKQFEAAV